MGQGLGSQEGHRPGFGRAFQVALRAGVLLHDVVGQAAAGYQQEPLEPEINNKVIAAVTGRRIIYPVAKHQAGVQGARAAQSGAGKTAGQPKQVGYSCRWIGLGGLIRHHSHLLSLLALQKKFPKSLSGMEILTNYDFPSLTKG
jgi:hypothetical protein